MKTFGLIIIITLTFGFISFKSKIPITNKPISINTKIESKKNIQTYNIVLNSNPKIPNLELPKPKENEQIINHFAYTLSYNELFEQANWVAYELTDIETISHFERTNKFIVDDLVKTGSASNDDYKKSGYDRGHLAPAGDMGWSEQAMKESFYYSNMSPQNPSFNRGIWKKTEELTREWAVENKSLYIVTGPILKKDLPTIGPNKVSIPNYYFKAILDYSEPEIKAIAFLIPNKASKELLQNFTVNIDSLEHLTGYDFYYQLPDSIENRLEKNNIISNWNWKETIIKKENNENKEQLKVSVQCLGTTKKGNRCLNKTLNASGYCRDHLNQKK